MSYPLVGGSRHASDEIEIVPHRPLRGQGLVPHLSPIDERLAGEDIDRQRQFDVAEFRRQLALMFGQYGYSRR
jgi:hypothetical protein